MNITCDRQQLLDALALASRAVSTRTTTSILECLLITAAEDGGLTLCGNDKEICIDTAPIPAQVDEAGSIALDAKMFTEIVRKMTGDAITIETDSKNNATCKSGRARLKIAGQPPEEFPVLTEGELEAVRARYTLKAAVLREMIKQTIFAVAVSKDKPVLTGELFEVKNGMLQIVAIDMFRIAYRSEPVGDEAQECSAVVSGKALAELSRILPADGDEEVNFFFTENRAVFETLQFRMVSSLLQGEFIRYEQIFNEDFATLAVVDRVAMLNSCERAVLIARDNLPLPIKIDIRDDDITITAQSERGNVDDGIPCETEGKELTIWFNPRYFIDALRVVDAEKVALKFNTVMSPCTIKDVDEESRFKYLIVPLRPQN